MLVENVLKERKNFVSESLVEKILYITYRIGKNAIFSGLF